MNKRKMKEIVKTILSIFVAFPLSVFVSYIVIEWIASYVKELF